MRYLCLVQELLVRLKHCLGVPSLLQVQGSLLVQHRLLQLLDLDGGICLVDDLIAEVAIDVFVLSVQGLVAIVGVDFIPL